MMRAASVLAGWAALSWLSAHLSVISAGLEDSCRAARNKFAAAKTDFAPALRQARATSLALPVKVGASAQALSVATL